MKTHKLLTATIAILAIGVIAGLVLFTLNSPFRVQGATGSAFHLVHEFVEGGVAGATTTTSVQIATTSPIYLLANSSSTITFLTAGVSDIRLNLIVHSTTTAEGSAPVITVSREIQAANAVDYFFESALSVSGVTETVNTPIISTWTAATSSKVNAFVPVSDNFAATSIHITNVNSQRIRFEIGSTAAVDLSVEIVKVTPF